MSNKTNFSANNRLLTSTEINEIIHQISDNNAWKMVELNSNKKDDLEFLLDNKILENTEDHFKSYEYQNFQINDAKSVFHISVLTMKGKSHISFTSQRQSEGITIKNDEVAKYINNWMFKWNRT